MIALLAVQSLVLAGWVVVSIGILAGMVRRSMAGAPWQAVRGYLRDPATRARRWTWAALTILLGLCLAASVTLLQSI